MLNRHSIPVNKLQRLLAEYTIEDKQPLSTVESPASKKLLGSIFLIQLPSRKFFTVYLDTIYDSMVSKVKKTLETVDMVLTTMMYGHHITEAIWR